MKKIVQYRGTAQHFWNRAVLHLIDHPDKSRVSNTKEVITSDVVSWDEITGVIETLNTIYKPEGSV